MTEEIFTKELAIWWVENSAKEPLSHAHRSLLHNACEEILRLHDVIDKLRGEADGMEK